MALALGTTLQGLTGGGAGMTLHSQVHLPYTSISATGNAGTQIFTITTPNVTLSGTKRFLIAIEVATLGQAYLLSARQGLASNPILSTTIPISSSLSGSTSEAVVYTILTLCNAPANTTYSITYEGLIFGGNSLRTTSSSMRYFGNVYYYIYTPAV